MRALNRWIILGPGTGRGVARARTRPEAVAALKKDLKVKPRRALPAGYCLIDADAARGLRRIAAALPRPSRVQYVERTAAHVPPTKVAARATAERAIRRNARYHLAGPDLALFGLIGPALARLFARRRRAA